MEHIKIHSKLKWLKPYLKSVEDIVPLKSLKRIRGYKVPVYKEELNDASIIKYSKNNYSINLRIANNMSGEGYKKAFFSPILLNLSHEISHLVHWDHTPEHLILEAKIYVRFAKVAKRLKIKDTWSRIK